MSRLLLEAGRRASRAPTPAPLLRRGAALASDSAHGTEAGASARLERSGDISVRLHHDLPEER